MKSRHFRKPISLLLASVLVFQLAGCGTILYPERRGQTRGEIDPAIALLDAVGLLFFIVPGVVAFIIDFNTGAIYLPHGKRARDRVDQLRDKLDGRLVTEGNRLVLYVDPQALSPETLEEIIREGTGSDFSIDHPDLRVYRFEETASLPPAFARLIRGVELPALASL